MAWTSEIFRSALDHVPDAVLISDADGTIHFANRQVPALFGYSTDEVLGDGIERLVPEHLRQKHAELRLGPAGGDWDRPMGWRQSFPARRKDGSVIPVQITLGTIRHADGTFVVAAVRDFAPYLELSRDLCRAREAAACAEASTADAREALANDRRARDARLASMSYSLRQQLQTLSLLNGLFGRGRELDPQILREVASSQGKVIGAMTSILDAFLARPHAADAAAAASPEGPDRSGAGGIEPAQGAPACSPAVLVVLHDGGTREAARGLLKLGGYAALPAGNLADARAIARLRPDIELLLTEESLGAAETGDQVISSLRAILGSGLGTVLLSHDSHLTPSTRCEAGGRVRIARMPVPAEELLRTLAGLRAAPRPP